MMMIELTAYGRKNLTPARECFATLEEAEAFFTAADTVDMVTDWRMAIYFNHSSIPTRSYGSNHPVNASADFAECIAMEREAL